MPRTMAKVTGQNAASSFPVELSTRLCHVVFLRRSLLVSQPVFDLYQLPGFVLTIISSRQERGSGLYGL